jgi:hypothetical protein
MDMELFTWCFGCWYDFIALHPSSKKQSLLYVLVVGSIRALTDPELRSIFLRYSNNAQYTPLNCDDKRTFVYPIAKPRLSLSFL